MSWYFPLFPPLISLHFLAFSLRSPQFFPKKDVQNTKPAPAKRRQGDSSLGPLFRGSPKTISSGTSSDYRGTSPPPTCRNITLHYVTLHYIMLRCVNIFIHTYIHTCMHTYIVLYIYAYIYIYTHIYIHIYIYIYIYTHLRIYIYIRTYTYIYINTHLRTYIYIYQHICISACQGFPFRATFKSGCIFAMAGHPEVHHAGRVQRVAGQGAAFVNGALCPLGALCPDSTCLRICFVFPCWF